MNSELTFIHSQTHGQELLRAAQREQLSDAAAASRSRQSDRRQPSPSPRSNRRWLLTFRRAAVGKV